jgi:hypothetical protein
LTQVDCAAKTLWQTVSRRGANFRILRGPFLASGKRCLDAMQQYCPPIFSTESPILLPKSGFNILEET